eukprot:m.91902 g.91902  ORF g.91902 m.91902 type:complete len:748 (-) comp15315_c1_seq1:13-2256(-)
MAGICVILLTMALLLFGGVFGESDEGSVEMDKFGNLHLYPAAGASVFINGVSFAAVLERINKLEQAPDCCRQSSTTTPTMTTATTITTTTTTMTTTTTTTTTTIAAIITTTTTITAAKTTSATSSTVSTATATTTTTPRTTWTSPMPSTLASSGVDTMLWTRLIGDYTEDRSEGLAVDSLGNVYMGGSSYSTAFGNVGGFGYGGAFLIQFNSNGVQQWIRTLPDARANRIITDSANNVYVSGYTVNRNLDGNRLPGNSGGFIAKYTVAGNKLWTRVLGSPVDTLSFGITLGKDGFLYMCGYSSTDLDGNSFAGGQNDAFLAKYDVDGNKIWSRLLGGSGNDEAHGVATDGESNIYITGWTDSPSFVGQGNADPGSYDIFLAKYATNGSRLWTRLYGGSGHETGRGIAVDDSNQVFVVGYTSWPAPYSLTVKFRQDGEQLWNRTRNSTLSMHATRWADNILITGETESQLGSDLYVPFISILNTNGSTLWNSDFNTAGYGTNIVVNSTTSDVYVLGITNSNFFGNTNHGDDDSFLIKYNFDLHALTPQTTVSPLPRTAPEVLFNITALDHSQCTGNWTTEVVQGMELCRRSSPIGCGSIFGFPSQPYVNVSGWVTLFQSGTCDAFSGMEGGTLGIGDSLSVWSGTNLVWDFVVGMSTSLSSAYGSGRCPALGGMPAPAELGGNWDCQSGNVKAIDYYSFYPTAIFGPGRPFRRSLPQATSDPIELRICLNLDYQDENIYLSNAFISVT